MGLVLGGAVGDAMGIRSEYRSSGQIEQMVRDNPGSWPYVFAPTTRADGSSWRAGEWSDDTDQTICVLSAYLEGLTAGQAPAAPIDLTRFAGLLVEWLEQGPTGGVGSYTRKVLAHAQFLDVPQEAARAVFLSEGGVPASNGAVMRAPVVGALRPWDLEWTGWESARLAQATHANPKCVASAVAVSVAAAVLIAGGSPLEAETQARRRAAAWDKGADAWFDLGLEDLQLDIGLDLWRRGHEPAPPVGYTYRTMGAAFWALRRAQELSMTMRHTRVFANVLREVILAGGDTDTNAAVACSLVGAWLGDQAIPETLRGSVGVWKTWSGSSGKGTLERLVRGLLERQDR